MSFDRYGSTPTAEIDPVYWQAQAAQRRWRLR